MATAAEPTLASTQWTSHISSQPPDKDGPPSKRRKLATGHCDVDSTLEGGLDYGCITCISGEAGAGAPEFTLALIASHLLATSDHVATVIDSTLSFDIRRLHRRVMEVLQSRDEGTAQCKAMEALGRLKLMKIFDFIGLTESLAEVRENVEGRAVAAASTVEPAQPTAPKGTIGDSEDEGEEMLDDVPSPSPRQQPAPQVPNAAKQLTDSVGLLIIDNITQVTAPLLKNNYAQGQALLTSFMRSLSHLTKANQLCTIMLNNTTTYAQAKEEPPSLFSSCTIRPALGKTFTYLLDMHLLVHAVPGTAADARAIYGGKRHEMQKLDVAMVSVIEVLQDRSGRRVGRWAPFVVEGDGRLKDAA
ncbi:hypothetical protein LTR36_008011 [Oleoguttula mirabilis]|uniref:RecA family profile 1 domain-containing protein n=1 Tax=Oleoguttula mirabilis TaxID=1507867 RepID=A0AAV9JAI1_9PEZI|nr:hypothetical protein LTR36_008011 [Oleoguttula mirabilis]